MTTPGPTLCNGGFFLRFMRFPEEDAGTLRTYVVRDNFSSAGGLFLSEGWPFSVNEIHAEGETTFDTIPGVEAANFAVNNTYLQTSQTLSVIFAEDAVIPTV